MTVFKYQVFVLTGTAHARVGVYGCLAAQVLAGALAASLPSALQAHLGGAGIGLGFSFGCAGALWMACLTGPVVLALLAQRDGLDGRARYLAGWRRPQHFCAALLATVVLMAASVTVAGVAGALVGVGDALRQGATPLTSPHLMNLPWLVLATSFGLAAALLAWGCTAATTTAVVVGGWAAFIALLPVTSGGAGRAVLALTPFAPAWSDVYAGGSFRLALQLSQDQSLWITLVWALAAAAAAFYGLVLPRPPR